MDRGLKGKAALVSGASKGIGRAIVQRLVAEGMQVLGIARGGCDVPGAIGLAADLRDPARRPRPSRMRWRIRPARPAGEQRRRDPARRFPGAGRHRLG